MKSFLLAIAALMAIQGHAFAMDTAHDHFQIARAETANQPHISLSEATQLVQNRTGGRVLAAQEIRERNAYRIKILTPQGEVRIIFVNADTGEME
ncbi:PepSY domain-containing protein [Sulfurirhabdus autotrophica]|uniref:PepSY domain-containing protein n=1 Tax=Sulfurirhabdus autotrophica TaxID=1706046 RepID=A0A4R3XYY3_9PROT|nr:PepSY domain-containing protein [Sulfurirhabdus autotrophica]TCV82903.1 hypothetical protein EDC63_11832 [Sulfurirhabdus autotrophica]